MLSDRRHLGVEEESSARMCKKTHERLKVEMNSCEWPQVDAVRKVVQEALDKEGCQKAKIR